MSIVKLNAFNSLSERLSCEIPELDGRVCAYPSASRRTVFPYIEIEPAYFEFIPQQEDIKHDIGPTVSVFEVGRHVGMVKIIIGAATQGKRIELEDEVLNLFLSQEGRPGILLTNPTHCGKYNFVSSWELQGHQWDNGTIKAQRLRSEIKINAVIPALVTRKDVYTIEQIRLGLQSPPTGTPSMAPPTEVVLIEEDGTISQSQGA